MKSKATSSHRIRGGLIASIRPRSLCALFSRNVSCIILAACWFPTHAHSQMSNGPNKPEAVREFETASFRISGDQVHMFSRSEPGSGEFFINNATLSILIQLAYGEVRVSGQPQWFNSTAYTIRATTPEGTVWSHDQTMIPLQHLLEERLHLKVRSSVSDVSGFELVTDKGDRAPTPTKGGTHKLNFYQGKDYGRISARNATMSEIATLLGHALGELPMVDGTHLGGKYDVQLSYAAPESVESNLPSLPSLVRDTLGLKIKKTKVNQETLAIESVDETPTSN